MAVDARRRRRRRIVIALVVGVVLYLGASCGAAWYLIHPPRRAVDQATARRSGFESTAIEEGTGVRLERWGADTERPAATVILIHGIASCRSASWVNGVRGEGFRVVAIDLRAHGESGGDRTGFGLDEADDVRATIRWVRGRWPESRLAAVGNSLGAAALIYAGDVARTLDAVVLESPYTTIESAYDRRIAKYAPTGFAWLAIGPRLVAEQSLGRRLADLRPIERAAALDGARTLFVTGSRDEKATPADMQEFAAKVAGSTVAIIPNASHEQLRAEGGADLIARECDFIRERLRR